MFPLHKNIYIFKEVVFMKKRFLSLFVCLAMVCCLFSAAGIDASAYSAHTQQEALNWVRNQVGKYIDFDGAYGAQCVDLIKAYYSYLGVSPAVGNGSDYASNTLPGGWNRIKGAAPQPGDILVYTGGYNNYGHVAIYEADRITYHQNFDGHSYVEKITYMYNGLSTPYWGVIRPDFSTHTHSYTGTVTKQPTCTQTGVMTYTCSCGKSYTESIPAKGHSYKTNVVAPTITEEGYTEHICSVCGYNYKDKYVNPPQLRGDGWYYCDTLPSDVSEDKYVIEYNNYYEKTQTTSPGADWTNVGAVKTEWKNSGSEYTSETDLPTSESRVLVRSVYYHFCIPGAGKDSEGNYELWGQFQHYDEISADRVNAYCAGNDNGHPYYLLSWSDGSRVYCKTGDTCDGTWGTHSERCKAWYKMNTYQDRVEVVTYKFCKNSGWVSAKDTESTSSTVRFKAKECSHEFSEWTVTKPATCIAEGEKTRECTHCGLEETAVIEKTEHTFVDEIVEPTTEEGGYTVHTCSVCDYSYKDNYTNPLKPDNPNAAQIVVDSKTANVGNKVTVNISLKNNPGITGFKFNVSYDSSVMTLENAESVGIDAFYSQNITDNPFIVSWESGESDLTVDGEIVKLTFVLNSDIGVGTYPITVTYDEDDVYNLKEENVHFDVVNGAINVISHLPGDINSDGKVNMKDLTRLHQYINGWNVTVDENAVDVNDDGKINMKDLTRLHQYINGWNVEIK